VEEPLLALLVPATAYVHNTSKARRVGGRGKIDEGGQQRKGSLTYSQESGRDDSESKTFSRSTRRIELEEIV